ncbi:hypothetical protein BU26DRAFT_566953 [Trematosphaeria pertusa]|uniref:Uncharacterized protein n=1 Tax=Trematosphaeria pertusa TaxID=390896 RepID=A0A6A6I7S1_9PLEO|nr:uncharacterized protein BU26DRAFT_566953 [Trematosphaeria pertusa]KAF2246595.1 hypothetical protein BU26DRAFT_566953 [Trematosphaeria pertusa]
MLRHALATTRLGFKPLPSTALRFFSTGPSLSCKARVSQLLEQAQSVLPEAYKTVKAKPPSDKAHRRSQLIWLVKHSLGKDPAANRIPSPHERPWDNSGARDDDSSNEKGAQSWEGPTVWPHLWFVSPFAVLWNIEYSYERQVSIFRLSADLESFHRRQPSLLPASRPATLRSDRTGFSQ